MQGIGEAFMALFVIAAFCAPVVLAAVLAAIVSIFIAVPFAPVIGVSAVVGAVLAFAASRMG